MPKSLNKILSYKKLIQNSQGFSLVEVVVVAVIISILAAVVIPPVIEHETKKARDEVAKTKLKDVGSLANSFYRMEINDPEGGGTIGHNSYSSITTTDGETTTTTTLCQYIKDQDSRYSGQIWGVGCASDGGDTDDGFSASEPRNVYVAEANGSSLELYTKSLSGYWYELVDPLDDPVKVDTCPTTSGC